MVEKFVEAVYVFSEAAGVYTASCLYIFLIINDETLIALPLLVSLKTSSSRCFT
jgi:hypothetical protein